MRNSLIISSVLTVLVAACTQPKYENAPGAASEPTGEQKKGDTAASCTLKFTNSGLCIAWQWQNKPTQKTTGQLIFKVFRLNVYDGTAVETDLAAMPSLVLWMPSMGHGSTPTKVERLDVGTYRANEVFFVMPGEWQFKFQLKDDGGEVVDEAVVSLTI